MERSKLFSVSASLSKKYQSVCQLFVTCEFETVFTQLNISKSIEYV